MSLAYHMPPCCEDAAGEPRMAGFEFEFLRVEELVAFVGEELDAVVNIDVPRDVILDRLTTRRTCEGCGEIYNVKSKPPKEEGKCDKCGGAVTQRDDETEEAIGNRLDVYNEQTAPLAGFYEKEGNLLTVAATSSDAVIDAIKERIGM